MSEDKDDKQFDPTDQKLQRAREKGDIPRSTELTTAVMYLGACLAFGFGALVLTPRWLALGARALGAEGWSAHGDGAIAQGAAGFAAVSTLALAALPLVLIFAGLVIQRALVFSPEKLAPDFKRIDPIKNAKQKFGREGLVQFAINLGKVGLVCAGGWLLFAMLVDRILSSAMSGEAWITALGTVLRQALFLALAVSVAFTAPDMLWKWFDHRRRNRMSHKEMQDEVKDAEGDPHLKAARRQRAVDVAMKQMLKDVGSADVVIVNPTHYAVALRWQRGSGRAPVCVAKGTDDVAARIRDKAREKGVPIWSDPPCARALHAQIGIGDEIRREHFAAVAAAIRFAEQMRAKARAGW